MCLTQRSLRSRTAMVMVVFAGFCLLSAGIAQAERLNLVQSFPDIFTGGILVQYNAASDSLTGVGTAGTFDLDGVAPAEHNIAGGGFNLDVTVDAGGVASSGTLTITGTIAALGANSGTLLTGTIADFGFSATPGFDTLDFVFDVTGGDLGAAYFTDQIGTWVHDTGFLGTFGSDFNNDFFGMGFGMGTSDAFHLPEPSSAVLLLLGLTGGFLMLAKRRFSCR